MKLIAMALDGTLLNTKKEISKINKLSLIRAKQKGFTLAIVTGRPYDRCIQYIKELDMYNPYDIVITYNGGFISSGDKTVSYSKKFLGETNSKLLISYLDDLNICYNIYFEDGIYTKELSKDLINQMVYDKVNINIQATSWDLKKNIYKIIIAETKEKLEIIKDNLPIEFKERMNVVSSTPYFLEFLPLDVSKGNALLWLCENKSIEAKDVIAFGDEENDYDMLRVAGHSYIMANSNPSLFKYGFLEIVSNDYDSGAITVNEYLDKI